MKYAKQEFERRFLLSGLPAGFSGDYRIIQDRYFSGTTLRLRKTKSAQEPDLQFKLTQKKKDSTGQIWITSTYITETEYRLLASLPGIDLAKQRHYSSLFPNVAVDVIPMTEGFMFIAELEGSSAEQVAGDFSDLSFTREITEDESFSGFRIALIQGGKGALRIVGDNPIYLPGKSDSHQLGCSGRRSEEMR